MWAAACGHARGEDVPAPSVEPNPLITTYADYWREGLRRETRPIRVEIVVSYYDPTWRNFWGEIEPHRRVRGVSR